MSMTTDLQTREGLPDALAILLREFPRDAWEVHPGFEGLVRFWLERHMMFRRILERLSQDTQLRLDNKMDPQKFRSGMSRLGGMFVSELHGHHTIEDRHYFPVLAGKDQRVARGFEILDADHHALDGHLNSYVEAANAALNAADGSTAELGNFLSTTEALEHMLSRHLIDEEELVVPVILKYGASGLG